MANPFLNSDNRDVETAIMLEKAMVCDIGKAVAYTDGDRVFLNTDDNLFNILPAYDSNMLKWLLWHERYHLELRHHNRFFKYLSEIRDAECEDKFHLSKEEVNIIMDILVHDSLSKMFPELVETARKNLAQMRDCNSLKYTFKSKTLEEMLNEYADYKKGEDKPTDSKGDGDKEEDEGESEDDKATSASKHSPDTKRDGDGECEHTELKEDRDDEESEPPEEEKEPETSGSKHDEVDWSKLDNLDPKEFITEEEGECYARAIEALKRKKFKLGKLTQTLNGLATTTKKRSYAMPSTIHVGKGVLMKGRTPGKTALYLCFDASGSMGSEMQTFKEIISKSIPQAMDVPTAWFSGDGERIPSDKSGRSYDYYKGTFKDFMPVHANSGYSDDGDRTIELCYLAEQAGYSPIGVTDGGGQISWSKDMLKQLKRTVLVGQCEGWLAKAKHINPKIQTISI